MSIRQPEVGAKPSGLTNVMTHPDFDKVMTELCSVGCTLLLATYVYDTSTMERSVFYKLIMIIGATILGIDAYFHY